MNIEPARTIIVFQGNRGIRNVIESAFSLPRDPPFEMGPCLAELGTRLRCLRNGSLSTADNQTDDLLACSP
jgi:hypothetical protein